MTWEKADEGGGAIRNTRRQFDSAVKELSFEVLHGVLGFSSEIWGAHLWQACSRRY